MQTDCQPTAKPLSTQPSRTDLLPRFEIPEDRNEQLIMLDAQEALRILVQTYTAARVASWLRFIAAQEGESL